MNNLVQLSLTVITLALSIPVQAGTWTALRDPTSGALNSGKAPGGIGMMLLLSDGTVMAQQVATAIWYRLTPNLQGSYVAGSWTTLTPMHEDRKFYSSVVLQDGRVFVAGGEYGTHGTTYDRGIDANGNVPPWDPNHALNEYLATGEIYDPVSNNWTVLPAVPAGWTNPNNAPNSSFAFGDSTCNLLPNGNPLIGPVYGHGSHSVVFDIGNNSWIEGPNYFNNANQNEASWLKIADGSVLTLPTNSLNSQRYVAASNTWVADGTVPVGLYSAYGSEIGAAVLLPDGRGFFIGASGKNAFYDPTAALVNRWTAAADTPNNPSGQTQGAPDAPAANLVNGKILMAVSRAPYFPAGATKAVVFDPVTRFYEYNPTTDAFASINGPNGSSAAHECYKISMLALPDGNVLYSDYGDQLYSYNPGGTPLAAGKPVISGLTPQADGSYLLTGTGLNGISYGAAYGDDAQMDSNYPIVRITQNSNGNVFYARTYHWSSTLVQTGSTVLSTEFTLPPALQKGGGGSYSLVVVASGIASDPVAFMGEMWVDFNYVPAPPFYLEFGNFIFPYNTLVEGTNAVGSGGVINIKAGHRNETVNHLNKPMTLRAYGGAAIIGQ